MFLPTTPSSHGHGHLFAVFGVTTRRYPFALSHSTMRPMDVLSWYAMRVEW